MPPTDRPRSELHRTISQALQAVRSREEQETLLGDDEEADAEGCIGLNETVFFTRNPHSSLPVYRTIHRIRRLVLATIEDPYPLEQLRSVRMNVSVVRPLADRFYDPDDVSVVYCLLVNRAQFLREKAQAPHHLTINGTRANLCEILAARILRRYDEDHPGRQGLLLLANILVAGFEPFQNAPVQVLDENGVQDPLIRTGYERALTALEIAIISESKLFLSTKSVQKVIEAVHIGRIVYTPISFIDIIPDHYKHRPISLYDPRRAPLLNQYRLIVPRTRNYIEVIQFIILLVLFILTLQNRNDNWFTPYEICFITYAAGWCLDEIASILEHGWRVHTENLWAFFDITFLLIYVVYAVMRLHGRAINNPELGRQALDVLAIAAPILLPRLAFNLMPENMLFVALRAMMGDFLVLTALAVWCFAGFLMAMSWLSRWGSFHKDHDPDPITISKWMLWIWFGLDGTGIDRSTDFHRIWGPVMMIMFAFLGNTLFLTILVSMLSNTFAKIVQDAAAEIQFRRAVLTFEGVKSDAIFAYRPPLNILALVFLLPLKFILSKRWFHKVHLTAVRITNAPLLIGICWFERRNLWRSRPSAGPGGPTKKSKWWFSGWSPFTVHEDIHAVFEAEPPQEMLNEIDEEDALDEDMLAGGLIGDSYSRTSVSGRRRDSNGDDRSWSRSVYRRRRRSSFVERQEPATTEHQL